MYLGAIAQQSINFTFININRVSMNLEEIQSSHSRTSGRRAALRPQPPPWRKGFLFVCSGKELYRLAALSAICQISLDVVSAAAVPEGSERAGSLKEGGLSSSPLGTRDTPYPRSRPANSRFGGGFQAPILQSWLTGCS